MRLRLLHPILAIAVGLVLILVAFLTRQMRPDGHTRLLSLILTSIVGLQLLAGLANVLLLTPVWLQLVHLLLADLVWIVLILLCGSALSETVDARFERSEQAIPNPSIMHVKAAEQR